MIQFVDSGADRRTLSSLPESKLQKAFRAGLIEKQVQVQGKHGTYTAVRLVRADKKKDTKHSKPSKPVEKKPVKSKSAPAFKALDKNHMYMDLSTQDVYSLDEVKSIYDELPSMDKKRHKTLESFVKSTYFISDGKSTTCDVFRTAPGRYKQDRFESVHLPIIYDFLDRAQDPPPSMKPVCFLYGGGSGSGKSSVVSSVVKPITDSVGIDLVTVDCDEIKPLLPEHDMFMAQNPDTTALREHRESSDIANTVISELTKSGKCFAYDGCMGDPSKYQRIINSLHNNGYEVHVVGVDIPVQTAIARAKTRERKIPEQTVKKTHKEFGSHFLDIAAMADSFSLYDNTQPSGQPPTLVVNQDGVHNEDLYKRFLDKQDGEV